MIVSIFMHKGGIGKSTITCTLAAACARAGLVTVIVEADGQGTASFYAGVPPRDLFYTWVKDGLPAVEIAPVPAAFHGEGELYVLSASRRQHEIESDPQSPRIIYERLRELNAYADVVIVDTSPGRTHIHAGMLYGADYVLIPTTCDAFSRESLAAVIQDYANAAAVGQRTNYPIAEVLGIVPNQFIAREDNQQDNYTFFREFYKNRFHVFEMVRNLAVWRQSAEMNQSIYQYRYEPTASEYARRQARSAAHEFQPIADAVIGLARAELSTRSAS